MLINDGDARFIGGAVELVKRGDRWFQLLLGVVQ